jgi:hypothetical protein
MTDIPGSKNLIQIEETQYRMPTSENLLTKIGASMNYFLDAPILSVQNNAGTTIPQTVETQIPFATTLVDNALSWDGSNYTIPSTGVYLIILKINIQNYIASRNIIRIKRNTSIVIASDAFYFAAGGGDPVSGMAIFAGTLSQTDVISATAQVSTGSSEPLYNSDVGANTLFIMRIG